MARILEGQKRPIRVLVYSKRGFSTLTESFAKEERSMNRAVVLLAIVALASVWGCSGDTTQMGTPVTSFEDVGTDATTLVSAVFCGKCGELKGTADCCLEGAELCASCNLHKGSALCCKLPAGVAGKDMCAKCGDVAGSELCCKEGAEICEKCTLHKGSALCCKLTQAPSFDPQLPSLDPEG